MFGNLHPLLFMTQKDVRTFTRLMEMLDEHSSSFMMKLDEFNLAKINHAYDAFQNTSKKLHSKLQEISQSILHTSVGIRPGMTIKLYKEGSDSITILKIASLYLSNASPLSSSPNQWEWRITGQSTNKDDINSFPMAVEYSLSGNISIERLALNGLWLPVIQYQEKPITVSKKKLAR